MASPASTAALRNRTWLWLLAIVVASFTLRFVTAVALPNIHRPDEVFQNLEPAYRMWSGGGVSTWEWRDGIRSPMFPGFLAGMIYAAEWLGFGPAGYITLIAAVLALVATSTPVIGFLLGRRHAGLAGAVLCGVICTVWSDLVYFGPKTLTEVQAGNLLVIPTFLAMTGPAAASAGSSRTRRSMRLFVIGLLLGLTFCVRFQLAPAIMIVALWAAGTSFRRSWPPLIAGILIPVMVMGLIDWAFWGSLFHSVVANWQVNFSQGVSGEFGVEPFYWFVAAYIYTWGTIALPIGIAMVFGWRKAPLLGVVAAVILVSHSVIAHKEFSFVFAALPPLFLLVGLGTAEMARQLGRSLPMVRTPVIVSGTMMLWMAFSLAAATNSVMRPQWRHRAGVLEAQALIRDDPELCGLGVRYPDVYWGTTGGDAHIGRPIPIYAFGTPSGVARVARAANYVIGGKTVTDGLAGFSVLRCWTGEADICVARAERGATCVADPTLDLNGVPNLGRLGTEHGADKPD